MMLIQIICYLIGGALSGLLAGLLGIGGGLVVVPFLVFALPYAGFPETHLMHVAVATSLANIVVTSIVSFYSHHRRNAVLWRVVNRINISCIVGAAAGAVLAIWLPSHILSLIFGIFVFFIAYLLLRPQTLEQKNRTLPPPVQLNSSAFGIATFCSLLGMGGGSLMVPFLNYYGISMRESIGTSAACGFFIALSGLVCLMLLQLHVSTSIHWMIGYLYLPAFLCMSVASVAFAPLGAKLAHTLPVPLLKKIFAGFLVIVGISMFYKSIF
ncbi:MAG: sulfite exporter TauE/SafE family protein [Legionellales bacterium]|nr:sulfite exporter TauE/SafE family protein [Legionellales bacterium]